MSLAALKPAPSMVLRSMSMRENFSAFWARVDAAESTLLQMVAGFEFPTEGEVLFEGSPITGPDHKRGIVFQEGSLLPWRTVEQNISLGLEIRGQREGSQARIHELIDLMGLRGFEKHYPAELSGGMAQRVAIARALINDANLLPFG